MQPTTLREAIDTGDLPSFESMIAAGARPDDGGDPPLLELAAARDEIAMARRLLELGAPIPPAALAHAARHADAALVELLAPRTTGGLDEALAAAAAATAGPPGTSGETDGLRDRVLAIVTTLLARGASADALARAAALHGDADWLMDRALDAGASPALVDAEGATLLHLAAAHHAHRVVERLLARGAPPLARDASGATALERAERAEVVSLPAKRLTLTALRRAGSAPPKRSRGRTREVPPARGVLRPGARVTHPKHGEGTVLGMKDGMARVRFSATLTAEIDVGEITAIR